MKTESIEKAYAYAKERYAAVGVDNDKAVELLKKTPISLHCWQADDVVSNAMRHSLVESKQPVTIQGVPET